MKKFNLKTTDPTKLDLEESKALYTFLLTQDIETIQRFLYWQLFKNPENKGSETSIFFKNYSSGIKWRNAVEPPDCKITISCKQMLNVHNSISFKGLAPVVSTLKPL